MEKQKWSFLLLGMIMFSLIFTSTSSTAASFSDVSSRYKDAVDFLIEREATQGLTPTLFGTQETIKRVDAAVLLAKVLNLDTDVEDSKFTDVPKRAVKYVNALKAAGITSGKTATTFDSNSNITRGELAIWIQRGFGLKGSGSNPFKDVAPRYVEAVSALVENSITLGYSNDRFGTTDNATRGQYALFLYRADQATPISITSVTAENGKLTVTLSKAISKYENADFSVTQYINGQVDGQIVPAKITVEDSNVTMTIPEVTASTTDQEVKYAVTYLNQEPCLSNTFTVDMFKVSSVKAENGKLTVTLSGEVNYIYEGDFSITQSINGEVSRGFTYTDWTVDKNVVVFTIPEVKPSKEEQRVAYSVSYLAKNPCTSNTFVVDKEKIKISSVTAENGKLTVELSDKVSNVSKKDFSITQTINGNKVGEFEPTNLTVENNEVVMTVPKVKANKAGSQDVVYSVSYLNQDPYLIGFYVPVLDINSVEAKNGELIVHFNDEVSNVSKNDFSIMQSINGGNVYTVEPTKLTVENNKVIITVPKVKASLQDQYVQYSVDFLYRGPLFANEFIVDKSAITNVKAENGKLIVELSEEVSDISVSDFSIMQLFNGSEFELVGASALTVEKNKVVMTIPKVQGTTNELIVGYQVWLDQNPENVCTSNTFVVDAVKIASVKAENGRLSVTFNDNVNWALLPHFFVIQSINGQVVGEVQAHQLYSENKTVVMEIPEVKESNVKQVVQYDVSVMGGDTVSSNTFIVKEDNISYVSAENGKLTVVLKEAVEKANVSDFSIKQSIDEGEQTTVHPSNIEVQGDTIVLTVPEIVNSNGVDQIVRYSVSYSDGFEKFSNYFAVNGISISYVTAEHGQLTIELDRIITEASKDDFVINQSITNQFGGNDTILQPETIEVKGNKVMITLPKVKATGVHQTIQYTVSYLGGIPFATDLIDLEAITITEVQAEDGTVAIKLSKSVNSVEAMDFSVTQYISGAGFRVKTMNPSKVTLDADGQTVYLTIPSVQNNGETVDVLTSVSYLDGPVVYGEKFTVSK